VAVPVGALILRRKGLYSRCSTACAQICYETAYKWTDSPARETACQGVPRPVLESALAFMSS